MSVGKPRINIDDHIVQTFVLLASNESEQLFFASILTTRKGNKQKQKHQNSLHHLFYTSTKLQNAPDLVCLKKISKTCNYFSSLNTSIML